MMAIPDLNTGKIPPQNIAAEEMTLGAMMVDPECLDGTMGIITTPECFYRPEHQHIFEVIRSLYTKHRNIDIVTVGSMLKTTGKLDEVGGSYYLAKLAGMVSSGIHAVDHSKIVSEMYIRRQLITIGYELAQNGYQELEPVEGMAETAQTKLLNLFHFDTSTVHKIGQVVDQVFGVIQKNVENDGQMIGIGTGLTEFDKHSGGLALSDLVIIAGESSHGKTSLALTIVNNAAKRFGAKIAFYSLEMSNMQLTARLMSQESGVNSNTLLHRRMAQEMVNHVAKSTWKLSDADIYFDDNFGTNVEKILRSIRSMVIKYEINVAVIDYLQLVSATIHGNKEQQTAYIARAFKNIAKELNICVIALSQLSRGDGGKPTLNRLRDSGQIEEAADVVMFTYRPVKHGRDYDEPFKNIDPTHTALIDVAKGRNIGTTMFMTTFDSTRLMFRDYEDYGAVYEPEQDERGF